VVEGPFAEVYGPDEHGDYVVVEKASGFLALLTHMLETRKDDPRLVESFGAFRVWWYEEILAFVSARERITKLVKEPLKKTLTIKHDPNPHHTGNTKEKLKTDF